MNRKTLFTAVVCALTFSMLGCGTSNKLQSIQVTATLINGQPPTSQTGVYNLQGNGGTIQFKAVASYSSAQTKDVTNQVTWSVIIDPIHNVDAFNNPLPTPCTAPCTGQGQGTVEFNTTGLITAVEPATCTWIDVVPAPGAPSWFYSGDYQLIATWEGVTSQPVYIPVASSAGNADNIFVVPNLINNNPTEQCGPTS